MAKTNLRPVAITGETGSTGVPRQSRKHDLPVLPKVNNNGGSTAAPVRAYYSRPELGTDPDGLQEILKQRGSELGKYSNALRASQRSHESDLWTLNEMLERYEVIRAGYEADPSEEMSAMMSEALSLITQQANKARASKEGYGSVYEQYLPVLEAYKTAEADFQRYIQSQQAQLQDWKSTIRDAGTIEADLAEIERQLRQVAASEPAKAGQGTYLQGGAAGRGTPYAAYLQTSEKDPRWDALAAQKALLQEELEWSRYFKYEDLKQNADFGELSKYAAQGSPDRSFQDLRYDYINKDGKTVMDQTIADQNSGAALAGTDFSWMQEMNEEQVAVYNYIYATQGAEAANEYVAYLKPTLTAKQREATEDIARKLAEEAPVFTSALSIGMAPLKGLSYLGQTMELLTRGTIDQNAGYNRFSYVPSAIRAQVSEAIEGSGKWGKVGSYTYQLGMSLADSLMNRLSVGNNAAFVRVLMGTAAAADGTIAAKDRGLTDEQAFTLGTIAGLAEAGIESLNMEEVFKPDMILDGIGKYVAKQAASEGGEELLTNAVNFIFDCVYAKDQSEWQLSIDAYMDDGLTRKEATKKAIFDQIVSMGLDFFGGAISGSAMSGFHAINYDTAVVAAPITIGDQTHAAAVILLRSDQTNRFYVHEVLTMENGALPFKTGTREGYPGGDAPSIFSILDKIRSVKNGSTSQEKFSADDMDTSGANELRENMTTKEREILRGVETRLLRNIGGALSVTKFGDRSYLKSVIRGLSDTYLKSGTIEQQAMDNLFEQAYRQGIVVDRELHDQYEEVRKYLHTVSLTLDPKDRSDIADYPDFVKRMRGRMRIVNEGGLPVDSAWHELNDMAPELFPDSIAHPADQLVRMTEVLESLRIAEKSLSDYYGPMASTYKKDAKAEFERAVRESIGELRQIRRFEQERQQKLQEAEPAPTTPEEAMEAWAKLKTARKTYEKAMAKNLLTTEDEIAVGELLKGKMLPEQLDKDNLNVKGILAVYEAKQEYEHLTKLLAEYRRKVKADIRAEADSYLETANTWKDKDNGLLYSREIMQRNVEDIVPDKKLAKRINERYFEPVRDAEAAAVKFKEEYREAMRKLNMSRKVQKGNLVSEAHAAQLYGEAMDNIRILEKARGRLKHRDGKSLEEWRGVVYKLWQENPGLDKVKIENALVEARRLYDEAFQKMNEVRVRWGYEPVNYRQGYFPHFQPGNGDGILAQFGRALGIDTQVVALPTTINGLTHTFKPGIQWFGNAQERLGFNTAYDLVEGFDRYIEGVASVIYQTENIQRLRAMASQIRYRTSDEGIRKQVDAIYNDSTLTEDRKRALVEDVYKNGKFTLSRFVVELDEYTNLLANKKSKLDRVWEDRLGRKFYTAMKWLESRVGANMIAGNVTSALTNFIPLTQASAQLSKKAMLKGMWDTLASYKTDDGIIDRSAFLTNRRGSDPLVKVWSAKVSEVLGKPMELIDSFTSGSIVRAAYYQNLKQGLSESEAMHQADIFASRVMAERSKGGMPTLFAATNPIDKLFTQFQLEVNNQWSEVFKDIPRSQREKGLGALALVFLQYFLGAWLFNNLYEKWIGRRPAMDPIDIVLDTVKDFASDDVSATDALGNLANNVLEELPFSSALTLVGIETDGGRVPVSSGIPNIPTLVTAATNKDWAPEKRWKEAQDELNKLAYVIPPFGGNQVSKIWKGIKAYVEGGSYSVDSDGNDILQYPVYNDESGDFWGLVQAMLLGKSALPEAKEWVEDGFDSFSAKQTAMYQDMVEAGVDQREAYEFLDTLRGIQGTEEEGKKYLQMKAILDADVQGEAKAIAYYGLLDKDDKNRGVMDALADLGADPGEAAETMIRLREANDLKAAEARALQAEVLRKSSLTESQKKEIVKSWLSKEELTEKGNLSDLGKFNFALKLGYGVDEYLMHRQSGSVDELIEYAESGMDTEDADQLASAMNQLEPEDGEDKVRDVQRWRACVDFSDDVDDQLSALSMVMDDSEMQKVELANSLGIVPDTFVSYYEVRGKYDADGNGFYKQAEVKETIDAEFGHLSAEEKAILWQIATGSSSTRKNPYSKDAGQKVLDAKSVLSEPEDEEELPGLTLGEW